jgi:hypothetical protein
VPRADRQEAQALPDLDVVCERVEERYHHEGPAHSESTRTEHYRWSGTTYVAR